MVPQRVSLVTSGARDLPLLRTFYQRLGWQEKAGSSDEMAVFLTAGVLLTLYPLAEMARDAGLPVPEASNSFHGVTLSINVEAPEGVDSAPGKTEAAGARVLRPATQAFWGGRTAYFADTEFNLWEIAWNPTAVFDARGAMLSF